jgi:tRNA (pseudouridine54-N1)-methyltransferase
MFSQLAGLAEPFTSGCPCNAVVAWLGPGRMLISLTPTIARKCMRTFVLRARAAPTDSQKLLASIGKEAHAEILAHTLMNAIFVAQSHRTDVRVYLVLESTQDFSRTICFDVNAMHEIGGFDERALLGKIAKALDVSRGMGKEETRAVESGVTVRTLSFERLVQELAVDHQLFVMDRKGTSIREQTFEANPCFLLTDHIPMPKNTFHTLERLGTKKLSLGSKMLFASQCVVLLHHELDQR